MEVRHLRSFMTLAAERHFGRAAAQLHIAQPALSQQIRQLERELGCVLFLRTTRRVDLTEAGRRFEDHARSILDSLTRATDDMEMLAAGRAGRVTAGFIGTATYDFLPRVSREVRATLPDIDLELRGEMLSPLLLDGLVDRTFDIVVARPDGVDRPGLQLEILRTEQLVAVLPVNHPCAGGEPIELKRLAGEPFVILPSGNRSFIHHRVLAACAAAGFRPTGTTEVAETATLVTFVAAGLGVALMPESTRSLMVEGIAYVPVVDAPFVDLVLATRRDESSVAVRAVATVVSRSVGRADAAKDGMPAKPATTS